MITVQIKINGKVIHSLSAVNKGKLEEAQRIKKENPNSQWRKYQLGCGCELEHDRSKGALCLLIQMAGHAEFCKKKFNIK